MDKCEKCKKCRYQDTIYPFDYPCTVCYPPEHEMFEPMHRRHKDAAD